MAPKYESVDTLKVGDHVWFKPSIRAMKEYGHITNINKTEKLVTIKEQGSRQEITMRDVRVHKIKPVPKPTPGKLMTRAQLRVAREAKEDAERRRKYSLLSIGDKVSYSNKYTSGRGRIVGIHKDEFYGVAVKTDSGIVNKNWDIMTRNIREDLGIGKGIMIFTPSQIKKLKKQ